MAKDLYWYNNAIIYALDIGVFKDSDNDGTGDFKGAIQKLDYLQDLGVNCIWLLPIYESSERDNGYDVEDYYNINRKFGDFDDFMEFKKEAEKRDMRIIMDLIVHHTSEDHPWFKLASHNKKSKYYKYYIWRQNPPAVQEETIFKGNTWKYSSFHGEYYYHKFYDFEPDLNVRNPEVINEIKEIIRFWSDFDVAGFRLDAATHLFDPFREEGEDRPGEVMEEFHKFITQIREDSFFLAEADVKESRIKEYVGEGNRMNLLFNFLLNNSLYLALVRQEAAPVVHCLKKTSQLPENVQWVNFIRNLDELDLERLPEDERKEVLQTFAPATRMQAYDRGIRRRFAPMMNGDVGRIKMVYNFLFALPGVPLVIYGDEIGMGDNLFYEDRIAVRTPMQWNSSKNAGFSDADEEDIPVKPVSEGIFSYHFVNVEEQQKDTHSLLHEIKKFTQMRKEQSRLFLEKFRIMPVSKREVLGLSYNDQLLIFINFSGKPLHLETKYDFSKYSVILEDHSYGIKNIDQSLTLQPYGYRWYAKS